MSVPNQSKTQYMCNTFVCEEPFTLKYCPDKCKTQ